MSVVHKTTATYAVSPLGPPPAGVTLASWDALGVWNLASPYVTGAAPSTVFKTPVTDPAWPPAGVSKVGTVVSMTGVGATLDGWDLRGLTALCKNNNQTVSNNLFDDTGSAGESCITAPSGGNFSGIRIHHNTIAGNQTGSVIGGIIALRGVGVTVECDHNRILYMPEDGINIGGDGHLVHDNYIDGGGFTSGAHSDQIVLTIRASGIKIYRNLLNYTAINGSPPTGVNNAIRIAALTTNDINGVEIYNNIINNMHGPGTAPTQCFSQGSVPISNVSYHDNLWDVNPSSTAWFYPITISNVNAVDLTNPVVYHTSTTFANNSTETDIKGITGDARMNQRGGGTKITPTSFSMPSDATGWSAYTSGGTVQTGMVGVTVSSNNKKLSDGTALTEMAIF